MRNTGRSSSNTLEYAYSIIIRIDTQVFNACFTADILAYRSRKSTGLITIYDISSVNFKNHVYGPA